MRVSTAVEFLQTDAAVNGGSSGSPVFNSDGEVVGIVSRLMSRSGASEGLAFATASNTAKRFLLDREPFWSGIDGLVVTGDLAKALNLPQPTGFLVQRVGDDWFQSKAQSRNDARHHTRNRHITWWRRDPQC